MQSLKRARIILGRGFRVLFLSFFIEEGKGVEVVTQRSPIPVVPLKWIRFLSVGERENLALEPRKNWEEIEWGWRV